MGNNDGFEGDSRSGSGRTDQGSGRTDQRSGRTDWVSGMTIGFGCYYNNYILKKMEQNIEKIYEYIFEKAVVALDDCDKMKIERSYEFLNDFKENRVIYGINTGFGPMAQYRVSEKELNELQYNIIRSHSSGAGRAMSLENVRAGMLARLQTFVVGKSGVHISVIETLIEFLNNDIIPFVPEHGGVGASGDLVQLSHVALTLIGEGEVFYKGRLMSTKDALELCNIKPLTLYIRDGLALVNGTSMMTGIGLVNLSKARRLLDWSVLASVMLNEIVSSYDDFMTEELNSLKNHAGQNDIAREMRNISASSKMLRSRKEKLYEGDNHEEVFKHKLQPFYSLRCIPQVLGPVKEVLDNVEKILVEEFNAVDDNPIVDVDSRSIYHGGNFHGDYVSFEMDKLKIAITKLTMLAERQLNYMFHDKVNEILPPFVNLGKLGLNYGLQAAQFTATSTTAENQMLSNPMYVHSIPCNNDNQDIVSMGSNSALIAQRVIDNAYQVMSIEMMALVQAVDCLKIEDKLSDKTRRLYDEVRGIVPCFVEDTPKYKEIEKLTDYLVSNKIK